MQISVRMHNMTIEPFTYVHSDRQKHHPFCLRKIATSFVGRLLWWLCVFRMNTSRFDARPFNYQETKSGSVQIFYKNKVVTTLTGKQAAKFVTKVSSSDEQSRQILMAKATGHFKHGNEKMSKNRR